jgi:hypothetical protein
MAPRGVVASSGRVLCVAVLSQRRPYCERGRVQARVKGKTKRRPETRASARLPRTARQVCDWMHSTSLSLNIPRVTPRPSSAASIRSTPSIRARSPSLLPDDTGKSIPFSRHPTEFYSAPLSSNTVSIRHHMSTLKHSIRHQQAQLQNLDNLLQLAPRMPMSLNPSSSPPPSPLPDPSDHTSTTPNGKVRRRSSFDILHSLAGPESNLPLPRREPGSLSQDGIREGVPMDFGVGLTSPSYKRQSSPTRTLSRACQSFNIRRH